MDHCEGKHYNIVEELQLIGNADVFLGFFTNQFVLFAPVQSELRYTDIITLKQGNITEGEGDSTQLPSLGTKIEFLSRLRFSIGCEIFSSDKYVRFAGCGTAFDFHKTMDYMFLVGEWVVTSFHS